MSGQSSAYPPFTLRTRRPEGRGGLRLLVLLVLAFPGFLAFQVRPLGQQLRAAEPTPAPLSPSEATRTMRLPEGFTVELFAAEPQLVQPVSFCIDQRERVWVAEALNYGDWKATGQDRIIVLEDTDHDGRADRKTLFYEGLNYVTGIEVGFGGVWVMSPPSLYFIPDADGDARPDGPPQVLFDGFGYRESRHNLANGFTWGPDGWLYAGHGRTSPSKVGRPGTPDNQRVLCDGGVYRIHPTRLVFENFADGTTNPWGVDFDDWGQCFVSNCVNPHLFHMLQGGHYEPWRNRPASLYAYERIPTIADHLHYPTGRTSVMRGESAETLALGGGHAHCGTLIYLADQFPAEYRNSVLMCNVHGRRVNRDRLKQQGSGYVASHAPDLMIAADPWFMGVTLKQTAAGGVLVSDWSDTGECHTYKPNRGSGRIYHIRYQSSAKQQDHPTHLEQLDDLALAKLHLHTNDWFVRHARRLLQERVARGTKISAAAVDFLDRTLRAHEDERRRLRALWTLHATGNLSSAKLMELLAADSAWIRAWSVQLLAEVPPTEQIRSRFAELAAAEPSPVVRLYLASALQRMPPATRRPLALALVRHAEDGDDVNLPYMIWYGVEPLIAEDADACWEVLSANTIPLVRRLTVRRFTEASLAQGQPQQISNLLQFIARHSPAGQTGKQAEREAVADWLQGLREGLRGTKKLAVPTTWKLVYEQLSKLADERIEEHLIALGLQFGDEQIITDLRAQVQDRTQDRERRRRALNVLLERQVPGLAPLLVQQLDDHQLREIALRGLVSYTSEETPARVLSSYTQWTVEERQQAVAALAARPTHAARLLDGIQQGIIPRADVSAFAARQIHAYNDEQLSTRLAKLWGAVRETPEQKRRQIERYRSLLNPAGLQTADAEHGRELYRKHCGQCHQLFGEGGKIGPDLTGSNRRNLDYLIGNIVDPSAEIGQDYRLSVLTLADGRVITGMIVEQTPQRLVVQTATDRLTLAKNDIEAIKESTQSMMPEGQLEPLSNQQIRDLLGYISGLIPSPAAQPTIPKTSGAGR
ncbi:MAG: PVC-type heme-binding CxxCH protein [Planctomycetota bacterium]